MRGRRSASTGSSALGRAVVAVGAAAALLLTAAPAHADDAAPPTTSAPVTSAEAPPAAAVSSSAEDGLPDDGLPDGALPDGEAAIGDDAATAGQTTADAPEQLDVPPSAPRADDSSSTIAETQVAPVQPAQAPASPLAVWEGAVADGAQIAVSGWVIDPDQPATSAAVHVYVDGVGQAVVADRARPDVAQVVPGAGSAHGFSVDVAVSPGAHSVCVYAIDLTGESPNTSLGCRSVPTETRLPVGTWESFTAAGGSVTVSGWALDLDAPRRPVQVQVFIDGVGLTATAAGARQDVAAVFPTAGPDHGFSLTNPVGAGTHRVCVQLVDGGGAGQVSLGCRSLTTGATSPVGTWEATTVDGADLQVTGWAFDPDEPWAYTQVHVYVDGRGVAVRADRPRADVAAVIPGAGPWTGFSSTVTVAPGAHTVCLYLIDTTGVAGATDLGCRTIATQVRAPVGNWEAVSAVAGRLTVSGWSVDLDRPATSTQIHVYVGGVGRAFTANGSRTDIAAVFPGAGSAHGFAATVDLPPGQQTVCVYAIDADGAGNNTVLGCRTVSRQAAQPIGNWESVTVARSTVTLGGWALDQDQPSAPVSVEVRIDGHRQPLVVAGAARADIGAAFPGAGAAHGFSPSYTLDPGDHEICLVAVDTELPSLTTPLGCRRASTQWNLPVGNWEVAQATGSTIRVAGWAYDPDDLQNGGQQLHARVDGALRTFGTASVRPDVAAAVPGLHAQAGFDQRIAVAPGPHTICLWAVDVQDSTRSTAFGCRSVVNPVMSPQELIDERWQLHGGATGMLGAPLEDAVCGLRAGGCIQEFERGTIVWTPARGALVLLGAVADAWAAEDAEDGPLGYPTESSRGGNGSTDWATGYFEHGRVSAMAGSGAVQYQVTLY